jgi:hypothetical protein
MIGLVGILFRNSNRWIYRCLVLGGLYIVGTPSAIYCLVLDSSRTVWCLRDWTKIKGSLGRSVIVDTGRGFLFSQPSSSGDC